VPRPARALLGVALLAATLAAGCERSRFEAAVARDTPDAYLGFLRSHDGGRFSAEARLRLEALRWKEARDSASVFAVRRYLADYPDGRFAAEARRRLTGLRFERVRGAGGPAELRRFLETAPEEPFAGEARQLLMRLEVRAALRAQDVALLRAVAEEFPDGPGVDEVRAALRAQELRAAGDDLSALERLTARYPGTPEAAAAGGRLADVEARRVRAAGSGGPAALLEFKVRYPGYHGLAALEADVASAVRRCAATWLDGDGMERWLRERPRHVQAAETRALLQESRRRPAVARRVRELLRAALPYQPAAPLDELRSRALGGELEAARAAVADLGHAPEPEAAALLVDLATGPQLVVAAQAVDTLLDSCRRRGSRDCADVLARAHTPRPGEPPGLRRALLRLALGDERGALRALADATVAGEPQGRARVLPAVLLARLRVRLGPPDPARAAVERALADVGAHLDALERLFPVDLDRDRRPEALLAARTAAALRRLVDSLGAPAGGPLRARLETRVHEWEQRLKAALPAFGPYAADPLGATVRAHGQRRAGAVQALEVLARKERIARPALQHAKADAEAHRLCPVPRGVGSGSRPTP
jgi:hypothetical protein